MWINTQHAEERMGDISSLDNLKSSTNYKVEDLLKLDHISDKVDQQISVLKEKFDSPSYEAQEQLAKLSSVIDSNETMNHYSLDINAIEMASMTWRLWELLEAEARV